MGDVETMWVDLMASPMAKVSCCIVPCSWPITNYTTLPYSARESGDGGERERSREIGKRARESFVSKGKIFSQCDRNRCQTNLTSNARYEL